MNSSFYRDYTTRYTAYYNKLREHIGKVPEITEFRVSRGFTEEVIAKAKITYVDKAVKFMIPGFVEELNSFGLIGGNGRLYLEKRILIPLFDGLGGVVGIAGYKGDSEQRYMYATPKFYASGTTMFGIENMGLALEKGVCILTEGITDALALRSLGVSVPVFALCGTRVSNYRLIQLNRMSGVVLIMDRDLPGIQAFNAVKKGLTTRMVSVSVPSSYKDIAKYIYSSPIDRGLLLEIIEAACKEVLSGWGSYKKEYYL